MFKIVCLLLSIAVHISNAGDKPEYRVDIQMLNDAMSIKNVCKLDSHNERYVATLDDGTTITALQVAGAVQCIHSAAPLNSTAQARYFTLLKRIYGSENK